MRLCVILWISHRHIGPTIGPIGPLHIYYSFPITKASNARWNPPPSLSHTHYMFFVEEEKKKKRKKGGFRVTEGEEDKVEEC